LHKESCSVVSLCNLCVLCVSVVYFCSEFITTETQRTQRLHRGIPEQGLFATYDCPTEASATGTSISRSERILLDERNLRSKDEAQSYCFRGRGAPIRSLAAASGEHLKNKSFPPALLSTLNERRNSP